MKGRTLIMKQMRNWFWQYDSKERNARGKKHPYVKATGKRASRKIRKQNKVDMREIEE